LSNRIFRTCVYLVRKGVLFRTLLLHEKKGHEGPGEGKGRIVGPRATMRRRPPMKLLRKKPRGLGLDSTRDGEAPRMPNGGRGEEIPPGVRACSSFRSWPRQWPQGRHGSPWTYIVLFLYIVFSILYIGASTFAALPMNSLFLAFFMASGINRAILGGSIWRYPVP